MKQKKTIFLFFSFLLFQYLIFAQSNNDDFVLTPFVGKIGLDTMSREEFIKYGKLQFNTDKIKIQSFVLCLSCKGYQDVSCYPYQGDSFVDERTMKLITTNDKKYPTWVTFVDIKFINTRNKMIDFDKNYAVTLKMSNQK